MGVTILGIESSCDDTSAAVICDEWLLSNVLANQSVHEKYGGVVPELASRAHQKNIIPVVDAAVKEAGIELKDLDAVAFTRGPGLLGSLIVGTSFSKGLSLSLDIPLIDVNHLKGHVFSHFIKQQGKENQQPEFPFISLLVSGGHTQIIVVENFHSMKIIGETIDDAAGEAFDKCAKVMGLPYPGGPVIDQLAKKGDPLRFKFSKPGISDYDFSFSGLKTSFLYFLRDEIKKNSGFIAKNKHDLAASLQKTIVDILLEKVVAASRNTGIGCVTLAGGVSANSAIRKGFTGMAEEENWKIHIPELRFTTDNAAMIAIAAYYDYLNHRQASLDVMPMARMKLYKGKQKTVF